MAIHITCSECQWSAKINDQYAGKKVRCKCGNVLQLPKPMSEDEFILAELIDSDGPSSGSPSLSDDLFDDVGAALPAWGNNTLPAAPTLPTPNYGSATPVHTPSWSGSGTNGGPRASEPVHPLVAKAEEEMKQQRARGKGNEQTPAWAWAFFVACGSIMIVTLGGAVWGALGCGAGGACVAIAKKENLPVAVRIGLCIVITGLLWTLVIGLMFNAPWGQR